MALVAPPPSSIPFASISESKACPPSSSFSFQVTQIEVKPEATVTREVIVSFLSRCDIPYPKVSYDFDFDARCRDEAHLRACPMNGTTSLSPFIPGGVAMATTAYAHLSNNSTKIFIALYTAFLIYLDDIFQHDVAAVREFNERFIGARSQADGVLDCFATLLREAPAHFGRVAANIIVTSTLNLVTALLLEYETQGMSLGLSADNYPTFSRVMSGASEAYSLFAFPPKLPLPSFIQALPDLMIYINNGNDILSFYKEEIAGETVNRVSFLAALRGTSKTEAIARLANDAVDAHKRVIQILAPHAEASAAYRGFSHGYIGFHAALTRYRLNELDL